MNFQEAERAYEDFRAQYNEGKLSNSDFENEVSKLKVQDAEGRWWQIGVQSGEWYVHDGQKWSKATPPVRPSAAPAIAPVAAAETAAATSAVGAVPAASQSAPPPKSSGPSRLTPRFFSAAPAGRGGGLPTPVLIGIVALIAIIGIAILVGAYMLISGQFGGATPTAVALRPTNTPFGGLAVIPTATVRVPSTLPPVATNTPVVVATAVVTPTTAATPTRPPGPTATPGAPRPTATKPPAPPAATATKAPVLPPGVYAMKMRTEPAQPVFGSPITFYVTFLNNTGEPGPSNWIVKIFRCAAACTGEELADNKSIGETPRVNKTVLPGTTELSAGPWTTGLGGCNYVASPYQVDRLGNVVPFAVQGGNRMYFNFKMCP